MRRLGRAAVAGFIVLLAVVGPAAAATPAPLDPPDLVAGQAVYDLAGIWSPEAVAAAEQEIDALTAATKTPVVVVSRPTGLDAVTEAQAIGDAALIMRDWEVGNPGRDDGLVILFDLDTTLRHGQIRIYPGYDLEASALPPDLAQAIFEESMVGPAVEGDLDGALLAGLGRIDETIRASLGVPLATDDGSGGILPGPGAVEDPGDLSGGIPVEQDPDTDPAPTFGPPPDPGQAFGAVVGFALVALVIGVALSATGRAGTASRRGNSGAAAGAAAGWWLWHDGHDHRDGGWPGGAGGIGGFGDGGGGGGGGGGGADGGSGGGGGGF